MATKIQWSEETWNPTTGCTIHSPGCRECYAMRLAHRLAKMGQPEKYGGLTQIVNGQAVWTGEVRLHPDLLDLPLRRKRPTLWFVDSMSDLFHADVSNEFIAAVFGAMAACPQHTFQVLTKRAERLPEWFAWYEQDRNPRRYRHPEIIEHAASVANSDRLFRAANERAGRNTWPLPNVWIGVSVEDQRRADERIPHLLKVPAAVRFLSVEPLLGPVDLTAVLMPDGDTLGSGLFSHGEGAGLSWVIVGGESGPSARPCPLASIRSIVNQCRAAHVSCFVKQLGKWIAGDHAGFCVQKWLLDDLNTVWVPPVIGPRARERPLNAAAFGLADQKGGDWGEWPADLRIREMPGEPVAPAGDHAALEAAGQGSLF